jgi:polysaccharide chain length determinant protein (PEP-CTERM system associated)
MTNTQKAPLTGLGEMTLQDYLAMARRRKFWIIFPALAVAIATAVTARMLPNVYRSEAVILVEPQKVPTSYVASTVTTGMSERMSTIYQEVTSTARLKRLIDSMGLYPDIRKQEGEQEAVRVMAKSITVEQVTALGSQAAAFRVTYKGRIPAETAQVTNQITAMFIEENLKVREEQSYGTSDFLEGELQKTSQELQDKANELAQARTRNGEGGAEMDQLGVQEIEILRQQLSTAQRQIAQDERNKADLQSIAATTAPTLDTDLGGSTSPDDAGTADLQTKLNSLRSRYGPMHPDVRKLQAEIDQAKAKQGEATTAAASTPSTTSTPAVRQVHNPVIEAQMEQLDQDIQKQKDLSTQLQGAIKERFEKLAGVPAYQQKVAAIQRDYDALQGRYKSLLEKKMSAETASALESREKSERFVLLDSAQVPDTPYSPNRPMLIVGGMFLGLLIGIGVALAREVLDDCVRTEREAERILGTSVLSAVPEILNPQQLWQSTLRVCAVGVVTVVCSVGLGIGLAHFSIRFL